MNMNNPARDKRFNIQDTLPGRDVLKQGNILLKIANDALSNVKFLGSEDMYAVTDAITLIHRALANREQVRRDWWTINYG